MGKNMLGYLLSWNINNQLEIVNMGMAKHSALSIYSMIIFNNSADR
jgi:hypothetical protein